MKTSQLPNSFSDSDVAIIGLSGRFPGAKDIDDFWHNLRDGVESITFFSAEELEAAGVEAALVKNPNYVKANGILPDIEKFDASFFGFSPREAEVMDPQHRLFLESAWEAIESAGYNPERFQSSIGQGAGQGAIGVYAGMLAGTNTYLLKNLISNSELVELVGGYQLGIGNDKDFLATRVAYKLNLKGPCVNVQTACSTSLVAVHLAVQSLLNGECDMALAGGVSIHIPQKTGYLYREGMILSPDGHCRAFDAGARGTVVGDGVGVVVLKRLAEAFEDGDCIQAIIKGSAINNDGSAKIGYTAPSVDGQAAVISEAQGIAGIPAETISYIETHGTGTVLGDPIEVAALTKAFRTSTDKKGFCAIASLKTNVGHLDSAAGVAGLIKTVLALKHGLLPPSLHFEEPNPEIDFENSPFYVNDRLSEWKTNGTPRRAGVSSFGIGGTNAHVVVEEAPQRETSGNTRPRQLLVISAKTSSALETATANLADYLKKQLEENTSVNLADVAYTLSVGRSYFSHRRILVCSDLEDAANALSTPNGRDGQQRVFSRIQESAKRPVAFLFSGQGAQYVNMARDLQIEPVFREQLDTCSEILKPHLGLDLREVLYPDKEGKEAAAEQLKQTAIAQPALFAIEYALSQLWMSWGIRPVAAIGHSIGEYTAACIAGVFSLEDALALVAARGKLMQQCEPGAMLAVSLPEPEVLPRLSGELSLAVINGVSKCVVSGPISAVDALENELTGDKVDCRRLHVSHAFHSQMMEPILEAFTERVKQVRLNAPKIRYISNVTGNWITAAEATDPSYWAKHLRQTVRFAEGLEKLLQEPEQVLLEVGPGKTLTTLAIQHPNKAPEQVALSSLRHPKDCQPDGAFVLTALGKLWLAGANVDWSGFYAEEQRYRLPLPTYPFERESYWIEPKKFSQGDRPSREKKSDIAEWFYVPSWKRSVASVQSQNQMETGARWLVFVDDCGLGKLLVEQLESRGQEVITVSRGDSRIAPTPAIASTRGDASKPAFGDRSYTINPGQFQDYDSLLSELRAENKIPQKILHLWNVTKPTGEEAIFPGEPALDLGFYSLLYLAQAIGKHSFASSASSADEVEIVVISNEVQEVTGEETLAPEKATLLGPSRTIAQEYSNIKCRTVDIVLPSSGTAREQQLVEQLLEEIQITPYRLAASDRVVAYRGSHRWVQTFEPMRLDESVAGISRLKEEGIYLITGGLGGLGLVLAEYLAKTVRAKLILIGRSPLPEKTEWEGLLASGAFRETPLHVPGETPLHIPGETPLHAKKIRKLKELEEFGAEVLAISADVANREEMQKAIAESKARFGRIDGVIHAAGVPAGGMIQLKTRSSVESILAPKVKGTVVLDSLLQDVPLDFCIFYSSITSILGGFGQVDYCAANAFLDAFTRDKARQNGKGVSPNAPTIACINWDIWQEVGMGAEAAKAAKVKESGDRPKLAKPEFAPIAHHLFEARAIGAANEQIYVTNFSPRQHWVLAEHRVMGKATLPGTAILEMARAAFECHTGEIAVEIKEVYFLTPLVLAEDEAKKVYTILRKKGTGFEFFAVSQVEETSESWQEHARGKIASLSATSAPKYDWGELESQCNERDIPVPGEVELFQTGFAEFGPRWDNLKRVKFGKSRGFAILELPENYAAETEQYRLHPALLDTGTGFLTARIKDEGKDKSSYLPFSYRGVTIRGSLSGILYSSIVGLEEKLGYNSFREGTLKFEVAIADEEGNELVRIEEYAMKKVETEKIAAPLPPSDSIMALMGYSADDRTADDNKPINLLSSDRLKAGILPEEGIEAFSRILGSKLSQVVVSTRDFSMRVERDDDLLAATALETLDVATQTKPKHSRPELGNAYVDPRNDTEENLAKIWQEFLGIEQIGIYDNVFELGADSLLATRVLARMHEEFLVELPLAIVFDEPTVAGQSAFINAALEAIAEATGQQEIETDEAIYFEIEEGEI